MCIRAPTAPAVGCYRSLHGDPTCEVFYARFVPKTRKGADKPGQRFLNHVLNVVRRNHCPHGACHGRCNCPQQPFQIEPVTFNRCPRKTRKIVATLDASLRIGSHRAIFVGTLALIVSAAFGIDHRTARSLPRGAPPGSSGSHPKNAGPNDIR